MRRQASVLLTQQKDPQTVPYLFDVLQDPSQEVQQGAVELLSVVGDPTSIKTAFGHFDTTSGNAAISSSIPWKRSNVPV